jgi:hypothetical protein
MNRSRGGFRPPADQEPPCWTGRGPGRHVEITPRLPENPSDEELLATIGRIADPEQALAAMSLALWPGWWSLDAETLKGNRPELAAARRVWAIGVNEPAREFVVAVYDMETAKRLQLVPATEEARR